MDSILDWIIEGVFQTLSIDKGAIKDQFIASDMEEYWNFLRDYVFNYRVWLMGLFPCLLLEWFFPAKKEQRIFSYNLILDILYPIFNFLFIFQISTFLTIGIKEFFDNHLGFLNLHIIDNWPTAIKILTFLIVNDFLLYFAHYLRHHVKWLWYFHIIHHSQEGLNAMTTHRVHFIDELAIAAIKTLPLMILGGDYPSFWLYLLVNNFWGYFIHANVQINLGPLNKVFVSPQFHRIHHSLLTEHIDKNFGERLVIWDWLFGTRVSDPNVYPNTGVQNIDRWVIENSKKPLELIRAFFAQTFYPFYEILNIRVLSRRITGT